MSQTCLMSATDGIICLMGATSGTNMSNYATVGQNCRNLICKSHYSCTNDRYTDPNITTRITSNLTTDCNVIKNLTKSILTLQRVYSSQLSKK